MLLRSLTIQSGMAAMNEVIWIEESQAFFLAILLAAITGTAIKYHHAARRHPTLGILGTSRSK